ncbi:hypothetical protein Tco_0742581, partial [Tanacetum coccineum]
MPVLKQHHLRIGPVAYKLELPEELSNVYSTFHISNLKKCLSDESLVIPMKELRLDDKLNFVEEPVEIIDREVKQLRQSHIPIIKVTEHLIARSDTDLKMAKLFDQPTQYSIDHQPQSIQEDLNQQRMNDVLKAVQSLVEKLCQQEKAANESTIPLNEITSQISPSNTITLILLIMEPEDSLIMGDENLSTIPEKKSNEFIKSSVEDLVPILSESKNTSDNDSDCDMPFYDNPVTFSNPLFDSNDDFTSSDDESFLEEDVPKENFKIYSNLL